MADDMRIVWRHRSGHVAWTKPLPAKQAEARMAELRSFSTLEYWTEPAEQRADYAAPDEVGES
jgi:hypothetical protein